jgi:hypothetical protein
MSTAVVFLDIGKDFDTTRHPGLLYKLHKLKLATNLIKLIKFTASVEGTMYKPR